MYATQQDLERHSSEQAIIDLTDRAVPGTGSANADIVNQALGGASSTIDGYLRGRYSVPLASPPAEIRDACVKLTFKELHVNGAYPEAVRQDYDDTISWLKDVSRGVVVLSIDAAPAATKDSEGAQYSGADRLFTRDTMKSF